MSIFVSEKQIPITRPVNMKEIGNLVRREYLSKGYLVEVSPSSSGVFISISKGGIFSKVLGMQTALNINVVTVENEVHVKANVGIFGQQAIPTVITLFVFWPVLCTQIIGIVQQAKLDNEVADFIEEIIRTQTDAESENEGIFCCACGHKIGKSVPFCPMCGEKQ